jgi:phosphoribosylamine--glycine ligase
LKTLIVGSGGREHALAWAISRSPKVNAIFSAPGNGGTAKLGTNVDIDVSDVDGLLQFAREHSIDLTVIGPEVPLMAGVVNRFREAGLRCYGPEAEAARLEGSKVFAKEFMQRHGIPTASFAVFTDAVEAKNYIGTQTVPIVIKADGLAAGKGVYVVDSIAAAEAAVDEIMLDRRFGDAGGRILVEGFLEGEEVSVHAICAGGRAVVLPSSQDHKRAFDGDLGPNTGGMGAYAPVPTFTVEDTNSVLETVIQPVLDGMAAEGVEFSGTLYVGLMRTADGDKVLEFNVRFGDPETEVLMPLIKSDVYDLLAAAADGELPEKVEFWEGRTAATVVLASGGYPGSYEKGFAITGLGDADADNIIPFHAGTEQRNSETVTTGGRVLAVTAWNDNIRGALDAAYGGVSQISFQGAFWRKDIGHRALK